MGKGALCPFLDYNGIKYKFVHQKGAVDKMLSHFITALDGYLLSSSHQFSGKAGCVIFSVCAPGMGVF